MIKRLRESLAAHIKEKYGVEISVALERPPKLEMGEAASPVCFELAKRLKKAPRQIAQDIAASLAKVEGIARVEVAGGGYLNAYFDRRAFWESAQSGPQAPTHGGHEKIIVEHTSINPNKAAHIGHVRNAVLGDTFVRILQAAGERVEVQNYIDNTGVQVADVVVGFIKLEHMTLEDIKALDSSLPAERPFDYY